MGGRRTGPALGAGAVLALVTAVLLTRGGTAAGEDDLALPPPPTAGVPDEPAPGPSAAPVEVGPDGTAGARLGPVPEPVDDASTWLDTGTTSTDGRCTLLEYLGGRPEVFVSGWEVDDRVVSVVMRSRTEPPPELRSAWGTTFGDDLDAVDTRAPTTAYEEQPEGATGPVRSVVTVVDGVEVVFSDVGPGVGISYIEVREPAGTDCRTDRPPWLAAPLAPDGLPVLEPGGRGPVRIGTAVEELPSLGLSRFPLDQEEARLVGCEVWYPPGDVPDPGTDVPVDLVGLGEVLVRDGAVVGVQVVAGTTAEGLAVGDPAEAVLAAYPELAVEGVDGDLLPPFPATLADGRRIDVVTGPVEVMPALVDAPVPAAAEVVRTVALQTRPCNG